MVSGSTVDRLEIFTASATLAAHASFNEHGFRLRDLRFFTELFLNWVEDINADPPSIQNTQLARYLTQLIGQGFAKRSIAEKHQCFRLTRLGIIELLTRIISSTNATQPSTTLFRICFVASYRSRLKALVEREGAHFPHSLKVELTALLDIDALIQHEIKRVERALQRIERRIDDALKTSALTKNRLAAHVPFSQVVQEVESRYPYELNSMKPLHELITSIAPDQRRWELEEGNLVRAHTLWEPQRGMLTELLHQLKALHAAHGAADKTPVES
jgi:hypothetical protein